MPNVVFDGIGTLVADAAASAALDYERLLVNIPRGAWVAISRDEKRLVAFGSEMLEVLRQARAQGESDPIIFRIPETQGALVM
jgi:hypothetical protein